VHSEPAGMLDLYDFLMVFCTSFFFIDLGGIKVKNQKSNQILVEKPRSDQISRAGSSC
jgi:hypothetical protein